MIPKRLNPVHIFSKTGDYLGTEADKTKAHPNAKGYKLRDIASFGSMDVSHGVKGLEKQVRRIRRHHHTKNAAYQFVLSPDPKKDHLDPKNPTDMFSFKQYVNLWVNTNFKHNFAWFADIQADSTHSHVHCHIVVINRNLKNNRSMTSDYYGLRHIRRSAHIATVKFNQTHQRKFTDVQGYTNQHDYIKDYAKVRKPTKRMSYIINHAKDIDDCHATNISDMKKWLLNHGIEAKRYKTTKSHRHGKNKSVLGWSYRPKGDKGRFIKSSTIAQCKGGSILMAYHLEAIRHHNNVERGRQIKRKRLASARTPAIRDNTEIIYNKNNSLVWKSNNKTQEITIEPISQALPKLSSDKVRKSAPVVFPTLQTSSRINPNTGLRRFHIISNELGYTSHDVSLFRSFLDPLISGLRSTSKKVQKWTKAKVNQAKTSIKTYFHQHGWDRLIDSYRQYGVSATIKGLIGHHSITLSSGGNSISPASSAVSSVTPSKSHSASNSINTNSRKFKMALRITRGANAKIPEANKLTKRDKAKYKSYMAKTAKENVITSSGYGLTSGISRQHSGHERE